MILPISDLRNGSICHSKFDKTFNFPSNSLSVLLAKSAMTGGNVLRFVDTSR